VETFTNMHDELIVTHALLTRNVFNVEAWSLLRDNKYDVFWNISEDAMRDRAVQLATNLGQRNFNVKFQRQLERLNALIVDHRRKKTEDNSTVTTTTTTKKNVWRGCGYIKRVT